jgi:hypothetical protein
MRVVIERHNFEHVQFMGVDDIWYCMGGVSVYEFRPNRALRLSLRNFFKY